MLRRFIAFFLLALMLVQPIGKLAIIIGYQLNKAYIAQNLCENRAKPQMHCNGKCHLRKQLEKQEKHETSNAAYPEVKAEISVYIAGFESGSFFLPSSVSEHSFYYLPSQSEKHLLPMMHPPAC